MLNYYENVAPLASQYDAFIVDLWGVVHDGIAPYPGVHQCLEQLRQAGKKVLFLSNAPRRAVKAVEGLARMDIHSGLYDHVVTSGEVTYHHLQKEHIPGFPLKGKSYFYIGPDKDADILAGLDYLQKDDSSDACFALVTGFDNDESTLEEKLPQLQAAFVHRLPLICANPDQVVVRHSGVHALCAGVLAEYYKKIGGTVHYFGKPYAEVYQTSMALLDNVPAHRIAVIGDSLTTDIKGGNAAELHTFLVPGGILGKELNIRHGELPEASQVKNLCEQYGITPTGLLAAFVW